MDFFQTKGLGVGYHGRILIGDMDITLEKGKILTLIGPNGAGKSTILKTITRQLAPIAGTVAVEGRAVGDWSARDFAKKTAVMLTDRIRPELMTCAEVVGMGRYPYTGMFGRLSPRDWEIVDQSLKRVNATDLAQQDYSTLSDGQRQRILLARAICQEPELLILDEPTAYLDIRHKIELLEVLRDMARTQGLTVILSLHEIDLAMKFSDYILCVKGDRIAAFGPPEDLTTPIEELYDITTGSYDPLFGSVELKKPQGEPVWFVVAGCGKGIPHYRILQKQDIPFATGILFENDMDYPVAKALSAAVVDTPAFCPISEETFAQAAEILRRCQYVLDAKAPVGPFNQANARLLQLAEEKQIPIFTKI